MTETTTLNELERSRVNRHVKSGLSPGLEVFH